ncbi:hypothetical protein [Methanospirillum sp.]|uniref:hypothetical protein n=1 Tax=Methanospirillum sp. TaxID=45200 RepID=UPI0029838C84|nr:hypothetical protein [Methanospirillum sp.]
MNAKNVSILVFITVCFIFIAGCTGGNDDEEYKALVIDAIEKLEPLNEKIINPYKGMTGDELMEMKSFAENAKSFAAQMTLSDSEKKSREFFIRAMDVTVEGTNNLQGNVDSSTGKVESTAPATNNFIQMQSDLGSAADIIKVPKKKSY